MANVKLVPDNSSVLIPRLFCRQPAAEMEFCRTVFAAQLLGQRAGPDGNVVHALLSISGAMVMIEAEYPSVPTRAPAPDGSSPVVIYLYVENVDQAIERAVAAGAKILLPVQNQFWGDRIAWIMDPAGHVWTIATRIEQTSSAERDQRWENIRSPAN